MLSADAIGGGVASRWLVVGALGQWMPLWADIAEEVVGRRKCRRRRQDTADLAKAR